MAKEMMTSLSLFVHQPGCKLLHSSLIRGHRLLFLLQLVLGSRPESVHHLMLLFQLGRVAACLAESGLEHGVFELCQSVLLALRRLLPSLVERGMAQSGVLPPRVLGVAQLRLHQLFSQEQGVFV